MTLAQAGNCLAAVSTPGSRSAIDCGAADLASASTASIAVFRSVSLLGVNAATDCAPFP